MTRREKITYSVIGIIILILLFLAFRRKVFAAPEIVNHADDAPLNYLTYNYPATILPMVSPNARDDAEASQVNPGAQYPTCGCLNISESVFASSHELTDHFNKMLGDLADVYIENVVGSLPTWFGSYINNTTGGALSWASQQSLQSI